MAVGRQTRSRAQAQLAIIGLGRIGGNLARQALKKGMRVAGFARRGPTDDLLHAGLVRAGRIEDLRELLAPPRVVLLSVPAGSAVDQVLELLCPVLQRGDAARAVAMMRHGFGGHPCGRDESVARERHEGRVGDFADPAEQPPRDA